MFPAACKENSLSGTPGLRFVIKVTFYGLLPECHLRQSPIRDELRWSVGFFHGYVATVAG